MRRLSSHPTAALLLLAIAACASAAPTEVTFLHLSDLHGHLIPRPNVRSDGNGHLQGGLARLYAKISAIRAQRPNVLLVNTGDTIQGSAEALFTRGQAMVEVLAPFRIDAFAPGNWDFVYGTDRFIELFAGEQPAAPWGALAANLYYATLEHDPATPYPQRSGHRVLPPYLVKQVGGVRIGILGLTANRGPQAVAQSVVHGFRFTGGNDEVAEWVPYLRRVERVDAVVLISELGLADNIRLAEEHAGIDLVLSSDSHEITRKPAVTRHGTVVVEEGQDGTVLGEVRLVIEDGAVRSWDYTLHTIDDTLPEDPELARTIAEQRAPFVAGERFTEQVNPFNHALLATPIDTVVGHTAVALYRGNFSHEPMPAVIEGSSHDFLADAFRAMTGADIGAIRGFRYGTQVAPGPIRLEDLYHFMPIGPQVAVGTIHGRELLEQIEASADGALNPDVAHWTGGGLFGYSGVTLDLNPYLPKGQRASNVRIGGRPLDPAGAYRYASYWYAQDPDRVNRTPARDIRVLTRPDGGPLDGTEVVVQYLQSLPGQTTDPVLHRITLLEPLPRPRPDLTVMQPLSGAVSPGQVRPQLHIDIPVTLAEAKVVFNVDTPKFDGDLPTALKFLGKVDKLFKRKGTRHHLVGVFQGEALYLLLNDAAYNRARHVTTGNPQREVVATLLREGVQIEACGSTMETRHWGNADLLPGVQVNEGALSRIVQLVQQGFVQLQP